MLRIIGLAVIFLSPGVLAQQGWPAKPIRLVVANAPGAVVDTGLRIIAGGLSGSLGQVVNIENRPGGDGFIAAEAVARSAPDGYTLYFASQSYFSVDPHIKKSMPADPEKDFTPIAVLVDDTGAIGVFAHPSLPFSGMKEMLGYARANPGKLTMAITTPHFSMLSSWMDKRAGVQILQVPYKGAPQAIQDVLAGRVALFLTNYGFFERYAKEGKVKTLASTRALDDAPQVPPLASIFPGFTYPSFFALVGPGGMPRDLVQRLNRGTAAVVEDPKFNASLAKVRWRNLEGARTPEGTAELMKQARADWGAFVREIGLKPE